MLSTNEIRRCFLDFFEKNGHELVPSSSLIPKDDPSLLFANAGMVQFKTLFQGLEKRSYKRATTAQKCLRVGGKHNDLENVGRTARHHTFFEMLGNFSFGDYFKREAISFAWRFIVDELRLPQEKLYVTVFENDDEAVRLWQEISQIPVERIIRMGEKDNFWTMGDTGPCGPCSEILIDQGEHLTCGPDCGIGRCECDRFLEIWNLVFMQYNQISPGCREPLPKPSIDTGMGLERIAAVCQGVYSNFDTDLFSGLIAFACTLAKVSYSRSTPNTNEVDTALRVIADHSRAIAFLIADGIMPSNEGRGYVLRRLIRRAYRFGRLIGMPAAFLYSTTDKVVDMMGDIYKELLQSREFMQRVVLEEEGRFAKTLDNGLVLLEETMAHLSAAGQTAIPGELAFRLYDTFGFPLDIVNDVAGKQGFSVDEQGFHTCMQEQKAKAQAAWKGSGEKNLLQRFAQLLEDGLSSVFLGYDLLESKSRIIALLDEHGESATSLLCGEKGWLVAGQTPFYGASGGQAGDRGWVSTSLGEGTITDTVCPLSGLTVHALQVNAGDFRLDAEIVLQVDAQARRATACHHSCTHLLHAALQDVIGTHARQAGSLVSPERLRFDFHHMSPLTPEELLTVENKVNTWIMDDLPFKTEVMPYDEAMDRGATALFGEKYAKTVRVVSVDEISAELCGGTHLNYTGQAGFLIILSEVGIAAGVRRIEALAGAAALAYIQEQRKNLKEIQTLCKCRPDELANRVAEMLKELKNHRHELVKAADSNIQALAKSLLKEIIPVGTVKLLSSRTQVQGIKALRDLADDLRSKIPSGVICLATEDKERVQIILVVSKDLHDRFTAPALLKVMAPFIDGAGGGRLDLVQAGGTNPQGLDQAFAALKTALSSHSS